MEEVDLQLPGRSGRECDEGLKRLCGSERGSDCHALPDCEEEDAEEDKDEVRGVFAHALEELAQLRRAIGAQRGDHRERMQESGQEEVLQAGRRRVVNWM